MRNIKKYMTENDFAQAENNSGYPYDSVTSIKPGMAYVKENRNVYFNNEPQHDYSYSEPFTIIFEDSGTFTFSNSLFESDTDLNLVIYKLNDGNWSVTPASSITETVNSGDTIQIKGTSIIRKWGAPISFMSENEPKRYSVRGNIMSVIYGEGFETAKNFKIGSFDNQPVTCSGFFGDGYESSRLTNAGDLLLPVTTLTERCYSNMFQDCALLTAAPELPATALAYYCYSSMFQGCYALTEAPELPATTLAESCYYCMFQGCTGITTAPELPATTLVDYCYSSMFIDCWNLNYIKCLATDISAEDCTSYWLNGVAASGTFVKNPNMTSWTTDEYGIPTGWTVQDAS